jgi:fatty acid desaturase
MDEQVTLALAPRLAAVVASDGTPWRRRRRELEPDFRRVWLDLGLCYAMLALGLAVHALVSMREPALLGWLVVPVAAIWIGFWLAALNLFGHEAGHSNLAASRVWNDRIGDWLVWSFFGQSVRMYRRSHWQHHLHLGDAADTETSYRNCLETGFLARAATGLHALAILGRYRQATDAASATSPRPQRQAESARSAAPASWTDRVVPALRSALLHGAILAALVLAGLWSTAAAWAFATAVVFPLLATVRQVLEHRPFDIDCDVDVVALAEGAANRMFPCDFFSRWLGAAGFNRHLLHHWDPGVSYTRFDDMERFLMATPLAARVDAARTTYASAWKQMRADAGRAS